MHGGLSDWDRNRRGALCYLQQIATQYSMQPLAQGFVLSAIHWEGELGGVQLMVIPCVYRNGRCNTLLLNSVPVGTLESEWYWHQKECPGILSCLEYKQCYDAFRKDVRMTCRSKWWNVRMTIEMLGLEGRDEEDLKEWKRKWLVLKLIHKLEN